MARGTCEKCGRSFRIPEGRRFAKCPRCGVRLTLEKAAGAPPAELEAEVLGPQEWIQAYRQIASVRIALILTGLVLVLWMTLFGMTSAIFDFSMVPLVVTAVLFAGIVAGFFLLPRFPFVTTLTLAIVLSIFSAFVIWLVLGPKDLVTIVSAFVLCGTTVYLWMSLSTAARLQAQLRTHPDLLTAPATGKALRVVKETKAGLVRKLAIFGGVTAVICGVLVYLAIDSTRPRTPERGGQQDAREIPDYEDVMDDFERAWNASDEAAVVKHFSNRNAKWIPNWLRRRREQDGWPESLPTLGEPEGVRSKATPYPQVIATYPLMGELEGTRLFVRWAYRDERWRISAFKIDE
jgi:hypothetical protein